MNTAINLDIAITHTSMTRRNATLKATGPPSSILTFFFSVVFIAGSPFKKS